MVDLRGGIMYKHRHVTLLSVKFSNKQRLEEAGINRVTVSQPTMRVNETETDL